MNEIALKFVGRNAEGSASNLVAKAPEGSPPTEPLAGTLLGFRQQEPAAQRNLILQTQDQVYRMVLRLVGLQDAEDVCQQVYLQVFRKIGQFRGGSTFSTWLYRVTVNEAMQHLRRRRTHRLEVLNSDTQDETPDRSRQAEARELLDRALAAIEPELRSIFLLREVEQLSYNEIAAVLGIPMGTVASRLSRARDELQQQLRILGWDD
jgi:RNA polymerase sigma-70 factor (ECF subfamily)